MNKHEVLLKTERKIWKSSYNYTLIFIYVIFSTERSFGFGTVLSPPPRHISRFNVTEILSLTNFDHIVTLTILNTFIKSNSLTQS